MTSVRLYFFLFILNFISCKKQDSKFDATGVFEAEEFIVSAETAGKIVAMNVDQGDQVEKGILAVKIDTTSLGLQLDQVLASKRALGKKTFQVEPQVRMIQDQIKVLETQLSNLQKEKNRFEDLVKAEAAPKKQLDDIIAQMEVVNKQIQVSRQQILVQQSTVSTQNKSILSEMDPIDKRVEQIQDQIRRCSVINPVSGTVLTLYAKENEVVAPGKAIYKIADLHTMTLKAYVQGPQLSQIHVGQDVSVFIDSSNNQYQEFKGKIKWVSDVAEFTPKTIMTQDERNNLVYAIKVEVPNEKKLIKMGMYGELSWNSQAK